MGKLIDLTEQRFGRLVARTRVGCNKQGRALWLCLCDEGNEVTVPSDSLRSGNTKSCGCFNIDRIRERNAHAIGSSGYNFKHGASCGGKRTPEFSSYRAMICRATSPKHVAYNRYGGRGVTVCDRWLDTEQGFQNFLADMGSRPKGKTLDRYPDPDGNYEPLNCRWATLSEQNKNQRRWIQKTEKAA